jgi:hypothetical protein
MNTHETELVKEVCPALGMLEALAEGCRKAMLLEPTYSALLLAQLAQGINNPPQHLQERGFKQMDLQWASKGAVGYFMDTTNDQEYKVTVEPMEKIK